MAAEIGAGLEVGPEPRIMDDAIVAGAEGLQFRPAIDLALDEADGLDGFQHTVIIEISQPAVPAPAAARES